MMIPVQGLGNAQHGHESLVVARNLLHAEIQPVRLTVSGFRQILVAVIAFDSVHKSFHQVPDPPQGESYHEDQNYDGSCGISVHVTFSTADIGRNSLGPDSIHLVWSSQMRSWSFALLS